MPVIQKLIKNSLTLNTPGVESFVISKEFTIFSDGQFRNYEKPLGRLKAVNMIDILQYDSRTKASMVETQKEEMIGAADHISASIEIDSAAGSDTYVAADTIKPEESPAPASIKSEETQKEDASVSEALKDNGKEIPAEKAPAPVKRVARATAKA